jgi:hypothetical protein
LAWFRIFGNDYHCRLTWTSGDDHDYHIWEAKTCGDEGLRTDGVENSVVVTLLVLSTHHTSPKSRMQSLG